MVNRRKYEWRLKRRTLMLGSRTLIMGVLNVTPDSFSDGGRYSDPDRAFARAIEMEEQGADIIDVGAESTRPGSSRIGETEELNRLMPVLKRLRGKLTVPVSVDTYKSSVAVRALDMGAEIINDPSGLTFDAQLARSVAQADGGLVLNHMRGTPDTWARLPPLHDPIVSVANDLEAGVHRALAAGLNRYRIVIDPGLGFGKRKEQNLEILSKLPWLQKLDYPILVGASRKSFLGQTNPAELAAAGAAAVTAAILRGAHIVRVHDVKETRAAAQIADCLLSQYFAGE